MIKRLVMFFHNRKIKALYKEIKNDLNDSDKKWLNLGYWKKANTISEAAKALVDLVIEKGNLGNNQNILDAGFGYGEQDIQILKDCPNSVIQAINISKHQIDYALKLRDDFNLQKRYFPKYGDAAKLADYKQSFDRIISIEAAFHFNTRKRFLQNAFKLLKQNGIICIADCLPSNDKEFITNYRFFKHIGIPKENLYSIEDYISMMEQIGYTRVEYFDISEDVLPYFIELTKKGNWQNSFKIEIDEQKKTELLNIWYSDFAFKMGFDKYYIITGAK